MKLRQLFCSLAGAVAIFPVMAQASADAPWPNPDKPIQIIVPAPGGGGTADTLARLLAERLRGKLGANVIIENRGGANGNIGAAHAATSPPDGSRFLFSWAGTLAVSPSLYAKLPFDPKTSFEPIALIADVPNILVVNNELPVKSVDDLVKHAKAHPDQLNFGSTGNGSSMHIAGALFMKETGASMVHIPYSAPSQATTNLIANDLQLMFQLVPGIVGQVRGGQVKALAVMSDRRSPALPDVPTTAELGYPALQASTWFAMLAPAGTPQPILNRMNSALNEILQEPDMVQKLAQMGAVPLGGTPEQLAKHLDAETGKWRGVIQAAAIPLQ